MIYIGHAREYLTDIFVPITELRTTDFQTPPVAVQAILVFLHVIVQNANVLQCFGNIEVIGSENCFLGFKSLLKLLQSGLIVSLFSINFAYPTLSIRHTLICGTKSR